MNKKKTNISIAGVVCLYCIMLLLILLKISNTGRMIRMVDVNEKTFCKNIYGYSIITSTNSSTRITQTNM